MSIHWINTDLGKCFGYDNNTRTFGDDCSDYWLSTIDGSVVGGVCFVFLVLFALIYAMARFCSTCCCILRGCKCPKDGSSRMSVLLFRTLFFFIVLGLTGSAIVTSHASSEFRDSVQDFKTVVADLENNMTNASTSFYYSYSNIVNHPNMSMQDLNGNVTLSYYVMSKWTDHVEDVEKNLTRWLWGIDVAVWLPVLIIYASFVFVLLNVHRVIPPLMFFFLFFFCMIVFSLQIASSVTDDFGYDICKDSVAFNATIHDFVTRPKSDRDYRAMEGLRELPDSLLSAYYTHQCVSNNALQYLCTHFFECDSECSRDYSVIGSYINSSVGLANFTKGDCTGSCSIPKCATECPSGSSVQQLSAAVMDLHESVMKNHPVIDFNARYIGTGSIFDSAMGQAIPVVCASSGVADKVGDLSHVSTVVAILCLLAAIFVALGSFLYLGTIASEEQQVLHIYTTSELPAVNYGAVPNGNDIYGVPEKTLPTAF